MTVFRFIAAEAWYEFRSACRGPLIPMLFAGLIAYVLIVILNADYLREWGATDVARNSPQIVYLMLSGQPLWLVFVWAWIFGQAVVRDRTASLQEIVLSAPVSLPALLVGRYLGALTLACLLSFGGVIGFLLVPFLGAIGIIPPDAAGPQPWFTIGHTFVIFTLPAAVGLGALLLYAAIRTRSVAGPFAVASGLMLVWMVGMVIVRGGEANAGLATLLDASGFAEVEEQTELWTPSEKRTGVLELTPPLLANRVIWTVPPLLLLGFTLRRVGREQLTLERAPAAPANGSSDEHETEPAHTTPVPGAPERSSWPRVTWNEMVWHLSLSFRGWGTLLALGMATIMGVGGSFVHVVLHADGPLVPRPDLLQPLLAELYYLMIVFMVAAFVGIMARRDDRAGYGEIVDAAPAPLGCRVAGRAFAAALVTMAFALTPTISVWIVPALSVPEAFSLLDPLIYFGLVFAPSLLELCAAVLVAHALIRHAGTAHAAGVFCAFMVVVSDELRVVSYPPAQIGIPAHVALAEFTAWAPWLGYVLASGAFKAALVVAAAGLAWLAWPRGAALTVPLRWRAGLGRAIGGAGALTAAGIVAAVGTHGVLYEQLVTAGGYQSAAAETADDAAWESRWWAQAAPFATTGGEVGIAVDPAARLATTHWRLDGVRSASGALHGSLPHGAGDPRATVDGREAPVTVAFDHFSLPLGDCGGEGCTIELEVTVDGDGWSAEGEIPWLHPAGVWLRAIDVLPTLGHDPDRLLRAPRERRDHGLAEVVPDAPAAALAPAAGVAPDGDWRWTVDFAGGGEAGTRTAADGRIRGPLDFAVAWWPDAPEETRRDGIAALHGPSRARDADGVLADVVEMQVCVAEVLSAAPRVATVLQAPRERGATALHGDLLWLPEDAGWDLAGEGFGRWNRRATIASAIAEAYVTTASGLRKEQGAEWLRLGVSGWVGMECVRRRDGADAWLALQTRVSDQTVAAFGALDAPAVSVALAGAADWLQRYAPLATAGWAETLGPPQAGEAVNAVVVAVSGGQPLAGALADAAGADVAAQLLGPPASSDILVDRTARALDIGGSRWRWRQGGWEPLEVPIHVTQRFEDESGSRRVGPVPATVDPGEPFTLLDAWPSFERTPADNVWRGDEDD
ncbi:MAG: ABC transporter permease [Acidobacteria bacterium]|nr:ABC transporter permease [Acidobacteriota bacterium]